MLTKKIATVLLGICFVFDLYFIWSGQNNPRFFTKTLLVPLLVVIYLAGIKPSKPNLLFFLGLIFSFFGDLFLLFNWGFLPGLGGFFLAHLFYIFCFKKLSVKNVALKYVVGIIIYCVTLIVFLFPHLNEMKIPVILYAIAISTMLYFSLKTNNRYLVFGALMFVLSDSILAINLFLKETVLLSLLVMITYVAAQLLLVMGMTKEKNNIHRID